jgi:hypothetical protein
MLDTETGRINARMSLCQRLLYNYLNFMKCIGELYYAILIFENGEIYLFKMFEFYTL